MPPARTAYRLACAFIVACACLPAATASAATFSAPTLEAPAASGAKLTEATSVKFEWRGSLQGDTDTTDRSFFRLEVAAADDVPSGAQSVWTALESYAITASGSDVTELEHGVPPAGSYRWRVCAWGVADRMSANEISQLPGGCSTSRAFTVAAATSSAGTVGELPIEERRQVAGETQTVYVDAPAEDRPVTEPAPTTTEEQPVVPEPREIVETVFTQLRTRSKDGADGSTLGSGGSSAMSLGGASDGASGLDSEQATSREGFGGTLMGGLGATLPLVPIPFWTLALLLACIPIARAWRGDVLRMFDWQDGSIDGRGQLVDVLGPLASVPVAHDLKGGPTTADGDAIARPGPSVNSDGGRRAA